MTTQEKVNLIYQDQVGGNATEMDAQLDELIEEFALGEEEVFEDTEDEVEEGESEAEAEGEIGG